LLALQKYKDLFQDYLAHLLHSLVWSPACSYHACHLDWVGDRHGCSRCGLTQSVASGLRSATMGLQICCRLGEFFFRMIVIWAMGKVFFFFSFFRREKWLFVREIRSSSSISFFGF
jgi:hypothetical protein